MKWKEGRKRFCRKCKKDTYYTYNGHDFICHDCWQEAMAKWVRGDLTDDTSTL